MDQKLKNFLIQGLRRLSYKWLPRTKAKMKSRVLAKDHPEIQDIGRTIYLYICEKCQKLFREKEVVLDHREPVVPLNGYKNGSDFDLNEYAERMFCEEDNFSVLCEICHNEKTKEENALRKDQKELRPAKKRSRQSRKAKA